MMRYETLFLTVPEISSDEASHIEGTIEKAIKDAQGSLISFERWGKYRLAYPVRGYDYGVYYLMRFEVNDAKKQALLDTLKTIMSVKYNEAIMRFMTTHLPKGSSLAYQRPDSLEEAPSRDGYRSRYSSESSEPRDTEATRELEAAA